MRSCALTALLLGVGLLLVRSLSWHPRRLPHSGRGRVMVIAHRGASEAAPENTLAAFRKALEMGADGLELDVMLSRDGEVVVIHDDTVDRTTDGKGRVQDLTLAQLRRLDAGSWFSPEFAGERIPTLHQVIEMAKGRGVLEIELKTDAILASSRLARRVARLVVESGLEGQAVVISFNPFALYHLRRASPALARGLSFSRNPVYYLRNRLLAWLAKPDAVRPAHRLVNEKRMRAFASSGYNVAPWTVDDAGEMRRLIGLGVDGIITNRPDLLREVLG